jgi:hypothetical protein
MSLVFMVSETLILIIAFAVIIIGSLILFFRMQKLLFKVLLVLIAIALLVGSWFWIMG